MTKALTKLCDNCQTSYTKLRYNAHVCVDVGDVPAWPLDMSLRIGDVVTLTDPTAFYASLVRAYGCRPVLPSASTGRLYDVDRAMLDTPAVVREAGISGRVRIGWDPDHDRAAWVDVARLTFHLRPVAIGRRA